MQVNFDIVISSIIGSVYGSVLAIVAVPLYSWALDQRENLRILATIFVSILGPSIILANNKTCEIFMIDKNMDYSGYFFLAFSFIVFVVYGIKLDIFRRKPNRN